MTPVTLTEVVCWVAKARRLRRIYAVRKDSSRGWRTDDSVLTLAGVSGQPECPGPTAEKIPMAIPVDAGQSWTLTSVHRHSSRWLLGCDGHQWQAGDTPIPHLRIRRSRRCSGQSGQAAGLSRGHPRPHRPQSERPTPPKPRDLKNDGWPTRCPKAESAPGSAPRSLPDPKDT